MEVFTIFVENQSGTALTTIAIQVRSASCMADGVFPTTEVGKIAEYDCSYQGNYVGKQRRLCAMGVEDGVWERITGICIHIGALICIIIVVFIVSVYFAFLVVCTRRKTRAIRNVKKLTRSKPAPKRTSSTKQRKE